jgi:hypothetical protein
MSTVEKLKHEVTAMIVLMLYFGLWIGALILLKHLVLAEYRIAAYGFSMAFVGALILSKVVLILEHVSLGDWVKKRPAWVDVVLRTGLYSFGVFVVVVLEKSFEGRHEYGGLGASLTAQFAQTDMLHVWLNTICLSAALFSYNLLSVVRRRLGEGALLRMFLEPLPDQPG